VAVTSAAENAPFFSAMEQGRSPSWPGSEVDVMPSGVEISNALASARWTSACSDVPFLTAVARGVPVVLIGHT
jgi:hypothetical protein